jgi:DsbC/DsbD-like thiol-disulfide interchange protein/cytochrome c biogenesis protein CcdA
MGRDFRGYRSILKSFACFVFATASVTVVCAQTNPQNGRHVTASLVAETRSIVPGQPFHLALRQQIQQGWHTYWSNPGDSGSPTTIEWTLPQAFAAGPIVWPTPDRFAYGPVVGYGYKDEVLLPVTIDVPANLQPGTDVPLSAHASWLACSDICIPEDAELSILVPVSAAGEPDSRWAKSFASTRSRTPTPNPFPTSVTATGDKLKLHVWTGDATRLRDVLFFPADMNVVDDDAPQEVKADSEGLMLTLFRIKGRSPPTMLNGVLAFHDLGVQDEDRFGAIVIATPVGLAVTGAPAELGLLSALLLAFVGGLILNLMPCVLPVLSIKAFGLVQHARSAPGEARLQGIAYTAGVLISFAAIAIALIGLRAAGAAVGWGFQLQSPFFVAAMIYVLFAVGLNLSGVFELGIGMSGFGSDLVSRDSYAGSFFTGTLATLVATPCTAPFMAAAIGYAITQAWYTSLAVFEAVGLGLAFPFLLLASIPGARRLLPKPGIWMLRLKQILAFPVYGTAVWLIFVLSSEAGSFAATVVLAGLVLIAFAAWLYEAVRLNDGQWRRWGVGLAALSAVGAFGLFYAIDDDRPRLATPAKEDAGLGWEPFSQARIEEIQAEGRPIFVDFTAAWCITCKVNERIALAVPTVRKAFADRGVAALKADWTRQDAGITRVLEANGRAGVPMYLFYPRAGATGERRAPIVLPQILTAEIILDALGRN